MFTVTMLCTPGRNILEKSVVMALCGAWAGREFGWLDPMNAAQFEILDMPDTQWTAWAEYQAIGIDVIVQQTEGRRKKMLLADMDSTMINQECIDELAAEAGVGAHVADITARAMNGELDFEDALRARVGLLKGLSVDVIDQVYQNRITLMPGGQELLATMKAGGAFAALVSGGFTDFTAKVSATLGFDKHRANTLLRDAQHLTGEVGLPILGRDAKVQALEEFSEANGLNDADVIAVGDGANDLGMLQRAGTGVALHAKPVVQDQVNVRINHGDLTALLYIQGYAKSEFAT